LILTCHAEITIPPECGFLLWLRKDHGDFAYSEVALKAFIQDLVVTKKFETWGLSADRLWQQLTLWQPASYAELAFAVYLAFSEHQGKNPTVWGDKNNYYVNHLDELLEIYPGAKFLHIVRDGRDVACSYREVAASQFTGKYAPKFSSDIEHIAQEWSANVKRVDAFFASIDVNNEHVLRYEDLVTSPESTMTRVCAWLGLDYQPQMLNYYSANQQQGLEPEATLGWKKRTMNPIGPETVGRYRELLGKGESEAFSAIAGAALRAHRYL
jgi:hypothetical protein